jgi:hypothetical protein
MNQVSNLKLAVTVWRAGAFPSLFLNINNYTESKHILNIFESATGSKNVVIPISIFQLDNPNVIDLLYNFAPSHIELLPADINGNRNNTIANLLNPVIISTITRLRQHSKIILRLFDPFDHPELLQYIDAFYIKGVESAGRTGSWAVKDLFLEQKKITPAKAVIPYGGIGTPDQVAWYMAHGADAVGVGTLFAACKESNLSIEVKQKLLNISSKDLTVLNDTQQNCVVFGSLPVEQNDWNRNNSLYSAIAGDGTQGHLYLGHSIDAVNKIRTVQETIEYLTSELH